MKTQFPAIAAAALGAVLAAAAPAPVGIPPGPVVVSHAWDSLKAAKEQDNNKNMVGPDGKKAAQTDTDIERHAMNLDRRHEEDPPSAAQTSSSSKSKKAAAPQDDKDEAARKGWKFAPKIIAPKARPRAEDFPPKTDQ